MHRVVGKLGAWALLYLFSWMEDAVIISDSMIVICSSQSC